MLRDHLTGLRTLLLLLDVVLAASIYVWLGQALPGGAVELSPDLHSAALVLGLISCLAWPLTLQNLNLYTSLRRGSLVRVALRLLAAGVVITLVLSASAFALALPAPPWFPAACAAAQLAALAAVRLVLFSGLRMMRRAGRNYRNLLVVGTGPRAQVVQGILAEHPEWGLRIVGFVDDGDADADPRVPGQRIHKLADFPALLRAEAIDEVILACSRSALVSLDGVVGECARIGVPVTLLSDVFGDRLPPPTVAPFGDLHALSFAPVHHSRTQLAVKRGLDVIGSAALLVATAPLLVVAAILVKATSPGPLLFRQIRCGLNRRRFEMLKLRTMVDDAPARLEELRHLNEMDGPVFKIRDDPRITPVGRFLRRWSIDELPQLWNVLKGDMSLVGPRPPVPGEVEQYAGTQWRRLSMRPGLTCLWQVSGRNHIGFEEWVRLDLEYIDGWSLRSDLVLIARTVPAIFSRRGAS